jgi:hypothetical protein
MLSIRADALIDEHYVEGLQCSWNSAKMSM